METAAAIKESKRWLLSTVFSSKPVFPVLWTVRVACGDENELSASLKIIYLTVIQSEGLPAQAESNVKRGETAAAQTRVIVHPRMEACHSNGGLFFFSGRSGWR